MPNFDFSSQQSQSGGAPPSNPSIFDTFNLNMEPQNSTNEAAPIAQRPAGALSPTAKAQAVFERDFPAGFEIIHTSANGLLCGFAAVIKSMEEMHKSSPNLPIPTMKELQDVRTSPAFMDLIRNTGLTNSNQFTIDQVGGVLYFWGLARNLNLRVGCVVEGSPPQLLSHANEDPAHIVWVHNDNFEASDVEGAISHFSGMRRKRRSYGFPASQLSAMQRGQQTTKGEFSETDGGVTGRPKLTPVSRLNRSLRQNGSPAASQASNTTTTEQTVPGRAAIKQKLAFEAFVRRFLPQLRKAYKSKHGQITDRYDCLRFVRELFQEYQTVIEKREQDSISQVEVHVAPYDQYPEVPIAYRFGNYQRPGQLKTSEVKSEVTKDGFFQPAFWKQVIPEGKEGFVTLEVLRETVDLGQHYYGAKVPARGKARTDVTSYLEAQRDWAWDAAHRPAILYRLRKTDHEDPDYSIRPLKDCEGRYVLNAERRIIKDFKNMPLTISSRIEGWRMAAIYREDSRISPSDFTDRILLKARCENRSYQIRNLVDHLRAPMIPWGSRNGSKDFDEKLLADLTPAQIHHNTTWGVPERTSEELRQLVSSENKQSNGSKRKMEEVVESTKGSKKQKCEGTGPHGVMTQKKRKRSAHAESMAPEGGQTVSFDEDYADKASTATNSLNAMGRELQGRMKRLKSGTTSTGGLQNADPDQKKTSNGPLMGMTGLAPQEGEVRQRPVEVPSHQDGHQNSTEEKPIRAAEAVDTGRMPCDTNEGVGQGVIHTDRESDLHASNAGEVSELRLTSTKRTGSAFKRKKSPVTRQGANCNTSDSGGPHRTSPCRNKKRYEPY